VALTYLESILMFLALTLVGAAIVYGAFRLLIMVGSGLEHLGQMLHSLRLRRRPKARRAWCNVVVSDNVQGELERWQRVLMHPHAYGRRWRQPPPTGLLLHGPRGVGKGLVAKSLASSTGYAFMEVTFTEGLSATLGNLHDPLFSLYRTAQDQAPCLVLLHHLEHAHPALLTVAMQEASWGRRRVFTVGTTEHLNAVDARLRVLFPLELAIELPDLRLRERLFALYTRPYRKRLAYSLEELTRASEGLSGRDICTVCQTAAFLAHSQRKRTVGYEAFAEAFKRCRGLEGQTTELKEPCFMCRGDDPHCPACHGTGYAEVVSS